MLSTQKEISGIAVEAKALCQLIIDPNLHKYFILSGYYLLARPVDHLIFEFLNEYILSGWN